ncbi:DNRLRE domain-containing protein [candidate division KSB1 bacterium]
MKQKLLNRYVILMFLTALTQAAFAQSITQIELPEGTKIIVNGAEIKNEVIISLPGDTTYTDKVVMENYFYRFNAQGPRLYGKFERNGNYVIFDCSSIVKKTELDFLDFGIKERIYIESGDSVVYRIISNLKWQLLETGRGKSITYHDTTGAVIFWTPQITAEYDGRSVIRDVYRCGSDLVIKFESGNYPVIIDPTIYYNWTYTNPARSTYIDTINPGTNFSTASNIYISYLDNYEARRLILDFSFLQNYRKSRVDSANFSINKNMYDPDTQKIVYNPLYSNYNEDFTITEATARISETGHNWNQLLALKDYLVDISTDTVTVTAANGWYKWDATEIVRAVVEHDSVWNFFISHIAYQSSQGGWKTSRWNLYSGIPFYIYTTDIAGPDTFYTAAQDTHQFKIYLGTGSGDEYVSLQVRIDSTLLYLDNLGNKVSEKEGSECYLFNNTLFDSAVITPNTPVTFIAQKDSGIYESDFDTLVVHSLVNDPDTLKFLSYDQDFIYMDFAGDGNPDTVEYCIYDEYNLTYYDTLGNDTSEVFWAKRESWKHADSVKIQFLTGIVVYRFKTKARNTDGIETEFSDVREVVTFDQLAKPQPPSVTAISDSQFFVSVTDTTNDSYNDVTFAVKDSINHFWFDTAGNHIDTALYSPKSSWSGFYAGGYSSNQEAGFINIASDSLKYNFLCSNQLNIFALTQPGTLSAEAVNDSLIKIIFGSDENSDSIRYVLFDSLSQKYYTLYGDSSNMVVKFKKVDIDTIYITASHPNKGFEFYTGSYNSDSVFSGYSAKAETWSWVLVPEIDSVRVLNKDSVFIRIFFPAENPVYSLYCIEDSVTGELFNIETRDFREESGYPAWCWGTKDEFGESGFIILTEAGRTYVIRIYGKEGKVK